MSVTTAALVVAFVAGAALAYAQQATVDIGFPFVVAGKDMAAGKYTIDVTAAGPVVLRGTASTLGLMTVITLLGRHDKDPDPELVFDKIGGKFFLSEVWLPGKDSCLLLGTKERHEHAVVVGSAPKK